MVFSNIIQFDQVTARTKKTEKNQITDGVIKDSIVKDTDINLLTLTTDPFELLGQLNPHGPCRCMSTLPHG